MAQTNVNIQMDEGMEEYLGMPDRFDMPAHEFENMVKEYFEVAGSDKTQEGAMIVYYLRRK